MIASVVLFIVIFVHVAGGLTNDSPAGNCVELQLNGHTFTLPDGFAIELAAKAPLVDRPITAAFDEQGRLYVTDSSGSNDKVDKQLAETPHRVMRLEDIDGDGVFDRSVVFADKLMFPEGSLWFDGSLYVSAPPSIWKLTDSDGDGFADRREEWFAGKTLTGCANDLHGPYLGPDGWIYWCKGAFARQTYERDAKSLRVIPDLPLNIVGKELPAGPSNQGARGKSEPAERRNTWSTRASHIFRCRPDGSGLEIVMTGGMDNPVDVVFTPSGERIFSTTFLQHPAGGRRDGLLHAVYGGIYGKDHDPIHEPQHQWTDPLLMPVLSHLGAAAPCGLTSFESNSFGTEYRNNLFACLFNMHKITRHALTPDGATFKSQDSDFLTSSNLDFHPTDILEDADGSLVIVDTGGWYKLCCPTSQLHKPDVLGAIYRVRRKDAARVHDPRGIELPWLRMPPTELVRLLDDPRPAVRERAIQRLAQCGAGSIDHLAAMAARHTVERSEQTHRKGNHVSDQAALSAVWALTRIEHSAARKAVRSAVRDADEVVRHAAIQSISLWRDAEAKSDLLHVLQSGTPQDCRIAAEALGRIGDPSVVAALLARVAIGRGSASGGREPIIRDRFLDHSITYALIEIGDPFATAAGLAHSDPHVRRIALIALDQMKAGVLSPGQVAELLDSPDAVVRETATWIVSMHAEWGDALSNYLRRRLAAVGETEDRELARQLARFARSSQVQDFLAAAIQSSADSTSRQRSSAGARRTALAAMRDSGLKELPKGWITALVGILCSTEQEMIDRAVWVTRSIPQPKDIVAEMTVALVGVAKQNRFDAATRLNALAAVPGGLAGVDADVFHLLREHVDSDRPVRLRSVAVEVLAKAKLTGAQLESLVDTLGTAGPLETDRLLAAFEGSSDPSIGLKLVDALSRSPVRTALRADSIQRSVAKCGPTVQQHAQALYASIHVDLGQQAKRLEELLQLVSKGGDVRRGQAVFMSNKAACVSCHQFGYLGGNVGPDLTRIGGIRSERDLLESIAFPSASFVRSYESIVIATRAGNVISGVLRKDGPDEVVLAVNATETVRVEREEIDEIRPGTVSVMPSGLEQQLSHDELADLIAFLRAAK
jgi:putative membrane-bound dehydrogenase-like protein